MDSVPNVLAERYASPKMREVWSARGKVLLEREFWIAVMKAQKELGSDIPVEAISAYEECKGEIDLEDIRKREKITHHDVKARIEAFCDLAGYEHIHKGLTSRDLTENVEQLQIYRSLSLTRFKSVAALLVLCRRAQEYKDLVITGRTHEMAAQPTTLGKRLVMHGEELLLSLCRIDELFSRYPFRGLKGAVGTQLDMLTLFDGDARKVAGLESRLLEHLGVEKVLRATGQVYPRSLDFEVVSALFQISCGPSSFAKSLRLMAGHELASEGFSEGQVGSSVMPHKMNSRSCERINGFNSILRGHVAMAASISGDQWNEGDVSCSVVRRVVLADSFLTIDGLLDTFISALLELKEFPASIERENNQYLPFLATTTVLMEAVKEGAGREFAHEVVREHSIRVRKDLLAGKIAENDLLDRLAADSRLGLSRTRLQEIVDRGIRLAGTASVQVDHFIKNSLSWKERFPEAENYLPDEIL